MVSLSMKVSGEKVVEHAEFQLDLIRLFNTARNLGEKMPLCRRNVY